MFQKLFKFSKKQSEIVNGLLVACCQKSINDDLRTEQEKSLSELCGKLDVEDSQFSIPSSVKEWWLEEKLFLNESDIKEDLYVESLIFRLLNIFCINHSSCPFKKETRNLITRKVKLVSDDDKFKNQNEILFKSFLEESVEFLETHSDSYIKVLLEKLNLLLNLNFDQEIYSATHECLSKDMQILKGVVVGGGAGIISSLMLGPVIGGYIGNAAGLYGAAATSYGMALLGGGSLAAGGFGMAGGSILIGSIFATANGYKNGVKESDINVLELAQAFVNLPLYIAQGKILKGIGYNSIPSEIRIHIETRFKELHSKHVETKLKYREPGSEEKIIIKNQKQTIAIYEKCVELSGSYEWTNSYDVLNVVKAKIKEHTNEKDN